MIFQLSLRRFMALRLFLVFSVIFLSFGLAGIFRDQLHATWTLLSLPILWRRGASEFLISKDVDGFDVTFASYDIHQTSAGTDFNDSVPAILHHISLGSAEPRKEWTSSRQSCLDLHPGWEHRLWTDDNAAKFVAEKFPGLKETWDSYPLPIQRIDALRYMVLYEYGGVILDMDLGCKRSLGPLRRFEFVAPAAFPTGFSISFLMASRHNEFILEVIQNLEMYNRYWFGIPYVAVMFSTGGHFASALHARYHDRSKLKILAGPGHDLSLHSLNGRVSTPLFKHLGSSSWHASDATLFTSMSGWLRWMLPLLLFATVATLLYVADRASRSRRKSRSAQQLRVDDIEKRSE